MDSDNHSYSLKTKCAVVNCSISEPQYLMFRFPQTPERYKKWAEFSKNPSLCLEEIQQVFMCKRHFSFSQFLNNAPLTLKQNAMPSFYVIDSSPKDSDIVNDVSSIPLSPNTDNFSQEDENDDDVIVIDVIQLNKPKRKIGTKIRPVLKGTSGKNKDMFVEKLSSNQRSKCFLSVKNLPSVNIPPIARPYITLEAGVQSFQSCFNIRNAETQTILNVPRNISPSLMIQPTMCTPIFTQSPWILNVLKKT
uniref:THAP-type domain-containing protein n=1 Tax=Clastoptera arizonana TaxID=38151 RepID=A0A1B6CFX5_9HEMI